jgi:hypothetical protein
MPGFELEPHFPLGAATYVDPTDGKDYSVPCVHATALQSSVAACQYPLIVNTNANEEGGPLCLLPCPSFMYSDAEWSQMYWSLIVPGLFGIFLNAIMLLDSMTANSKTSRKFEPIFCYCVGLIWGVGPLFSAALYTDVACADGCDNQECMSSGTVCSVYKVSPFLLQSMQFMICSMSAELYMRVEKGSPQVQTLHGRSTERGRVGSCHVDGAVLFDRDGRP